MALKKIHNEAELLEKISSGDQEAFSELFHAYHHPVGVFVSTLIDSPEMTEDIIQDIFVKVWTEREHIPHINNFTSYLFILTRNYALNYIRKLNNERRRQLAYFEMNQAAFSVAGQETEQDYFALIDRAVEQLPPQQQRVFMLRKQGFKNPEIVQLLGITINSVKKYQQMALRAVSDFVKMHTMISIMMITGWL